MRVAIAGAAALTAEGHVMNLGDEAIADTLGAAVAQHATVSRVVTALNVRLAGGAPPSGRFSPRPVLALERAVAAADAVLIGGGTMLQEDVLPRHRLAVRGLLRYQLAVGLACMARRTPYAYALVGAEMLDRPGARRVARFLVEHAACVAVRDGPSARMVRALASPKRLVVGADAVFLAEWPPCPAVPRSRIAVSLRIDCSSDALRLLAQVIDEMFPDAGILLVPTDGASMPMPGSCENFEASWLHRSAQSASHPRAAGASSCVSWKRVDSPSACGCTSSCSLCSRAPRPSGSRRLSSSAASLRTAVSASSTVRTRRHYARRW